MYDKIGKIAKNRKNRKIISIPPNSSFLFIFKIFFIYL